MFKVVHLTSVHHPFDTRIFHKECKALRRAGYNVVLISPHDRTEVVDGVRIRAIPKVLRRFEIIGKIERMTKSVRAISRAAVEERADIYHFHDVELIPVGILLRWRGNRVIYDIHEDYPLDILSKYYLPAWLRPLLARIVKIIEDYAARRFSALIVVRPVFPRFQHLNERVVTVQNFPLLSEFSELAGDNTLEQPWSQREAAVAYIGDITIVRCIRQMISAISLLPEDCAAELHLAGNYFPEGLRDELTNLLGWERVHELGYIDRRGVKQSLSRVKAGLVLFRPEPNYMNAYPNKMFEYMAAGIPVIASDFPLWREIVQEAGCGILVNPLDPKAIAAAIKYVLNNATAAEAMGRRGRRVVEERYNWENEEKKLLALYGELLPEISRSGEAHKRLTEQKIG
jgi:glycosyltransferase involved in cell wall biosynthesis